VNAGDAFLIDEPGTSYDSHLWIIISDPDVDHFVLLVNFTSWRSDKDQACVIEPDEYPRYLSKKTCVNYAKAKHVSSANLRQLVDKGFVTHHGTVSQQLLDKIRDGAGMSKEIELGTWQILVEQGLVDE